MALRGETGVNERNLSTPIKFTIELLDRRIKSDNCSDSRRRRRVLITGMQQHTAAMDRWKPNTRHETPNDDSEH
ncbi:unnamed protein product [Gongylonema pulchrum]|uniref:Uncharacterized protein n=1 Tax=Gongylonema pulchrum TaxID=637853 RepID=A0A183DNQ3_9BILA|nr:unnamed protein product [Gongylonema pulchrum]